MENQASIRDFFNKIQAAAATSNAPLPWELLHTPATASRFSGMPGAPALSRAAAHVGDDYGVGLPPMAGC